MPKHRRPKNEVLTRSAPFTLDERKIDAEKRTVVLPFSSELPVRRWDGDEVLRHDAESIDFSRLNAGAAVLEDHAGRQIGVVERAWLGDDRRAYAELRFSRNQQGSEVLQDIEDGIRRNVSFGYRVDEWKEEEDEETKETRYIGTRWTPHEISIVAVPADPTVGVGRSLPEGTDEARDEAGIAPEPPATIEVTNETKTTEGKTMDKKDIQLITAIGRQFDCVAEADAAIEAEISVDEFRAQVLDIQAKRNSKPTPAAKVGLPVGLSEPEARQYSFFRAMRVLAFPQDAEMRKAAAFEIECSNAYAKQIGKDTPGFFVPPDVMLSQTRAFNLTTGAGSNLRATDLRADMFIDLLRNQTVVMALGAQSMAGLVGNVAIPRQTAAGTAYWINTESANITGASNPTIDQVTLTPKTIGAYTDVSRLLLRQSTPDAENIVRNDLARVLALGIDLAALAGTGLNAQPTGITATSGISDDDWATANTPTWAELVGMETAVDTANALDGELAYVMGAAMFGALKTTPKVANYPVYMLENGMLNGYKVARTNQLGAGEMIFGRFADVLIGMWGGLEIQADTTTLGLSGGVRFVALQDVDVAIRHAASFAYRSNAAAT